MEVRDEAGGAREELDGWPEEVLEGVALGEVGVEGELDAREGGEEVLGCLEFGWRASVSE